MDVTLGCKDGDPIDGALIKKKHPGHPRSNIAAFSSYDPDKYAIKNVNQTVISSEAMTPLGPPRLTQHAIGKYLRPTTRELDEVPPCPSFDELPDSVINRMLDRDKAFWVCAPGRNAYELTDAFYRCNLSTNKVLPNPQSVFPRSYEYYWNTITYRRRIACFDKNRQTPAPPQCQDCSRLAPGLTPFQRFWLSDTTQKRWRYYPDLNANLTLDEIHNGMKGVGLPFKHDACTWYNTNFPSVKYDFIIRKFSG